MPTASVCGHEQEYVHEDEYVHGHEDKDERSCGAASRWVLVVDARVMRFSVRQRVGGFEEED